MVWSPTGRVTSGAIRGSILQNTSELAAGPAHTPCNPLGETKPRGAGGTWEGGLDFWGPWLSRGTGWPTPLEPGQKKRKALCLGWTSRWASASWVCHAREEKVDGPGSVQSPSGERKAPWGSNHCLLYLWRRWSQTLPRNTEQKGKRWPSHLVARNISCWTQGKILHSERG